MKGVHAARHPRHDRRNAAERARLGGMGMHDVRPEAAHLSGQCGQRAQVIGRPDASPERRHPVDSQSGSTQIDIVGLIWLDEPRVQPLLEPVGREPAHERHRLQRWAAHIHPRDNPHHPQRLGPMNHVCLPLNARSV